MWLTSRKDKKHTANTPAVSVSIRDTMDEKTLAKEELIGLQVTIKDCTDPSWEGTSGRIIDETKHTFLIEVDDKHRRIAKHIATFEFDYHNEKIRIQGSKLTYRPEDRIKKIR